MAACQVIQKHGDADVALSKYRIVYGRKPECAQVWNNIGMCFFSKKKFVAAISCLKRANYLAPFELNVLYNLALVHLYLQQSASAAVFLQSAIRLNRKHAPSYALLGVTLSKLNDFSNALQAFTYSLKLDPTNLVALLNLAILQKNTDVVQSTIESTLSEFHRSYNQHTASGRQGELDKSMLDIASKLGVPQSVATYRNESTAPASLSAILSPRKLADDDVLASSLGQSQELPDLKTKRYEDGRYKQRRVKQEPVVSSTETTEQRSNFAF
ncbi:unnamed protein product [Adineta ricciae]|nr:unnamed protein product [Adineta ricciae]